MAQQKSFIRFSFDDSDKESLLHAPEKALSLAINIQEYDESSGHFVQKRPTKYALWNKKQPIDASLDHHRRRIEILVVSTAFVESLPDQDKQYLSKRFAIYVQTYSILKLIEPIVFDDNNLIVNDVFKDTGKFMIPMHNKNVYVRLTAVNNAQANGFSPNARIKVNVALANPNAAKFKQWATWLDDRAINSSDHENGHERARQEIKAGRKKAIVNNNGHRFQLFMASLLEKFLTKKVPCAISGNDVQAVGYRCAHCMMVVRCDYVNNPNIPICQAFQDRETNKEAIQGAKHEKLVMKRLKITTKTCDHSGEVLGRFSKVLVCLDCGKCFNPKYKNVLIPNCQNTDIYGQLKNIKNQDDNIYGNIADLDSLASSTATSSMTSSNTSTSTVTETPKAPYENPDKTDLVNTVSNMSLTNLDIKDYKFINKLGEGTYGLVLGSKHKNAKKGKFTALKIVTKQGILDHGLPQDVLNEEIVLKICTEAFNKNLVKNVCTLTEGTWQDHNRLYFAMEHLPNHTMFYHCAENPDTKGKQKTEFCQYYGTEVGLGLTFLHERHIIHRDLKLENIALDVEGHARLIDFGMVKLDADKSNAKSFVGTPNYIAPEMIQTGNYNVEVDWWALGVLIYEMHSNKNLFNGKTEDEMYGKICKMKLDFSRCEKEITTILQLLLVRDPKRRLSYNRKRAEKDQPMAQRFFSQGAQLTQTQPPPISCSYIADEEAENEQDQIYHARSVSKFTRKRNKKDVLLPACNDRLTQEKNAKFNTFGYVNPQM